MSSFSLLLIISGLIDYNFHIFQQAIHQVFDLRNKPTNPGPTTTTSVERPQVNGIPEKPNSGQQTWLSLSHIK